MTLIEASFNGTLRAGFDSGADDYMVKPFALQEIEARINVLGKRGRAPSTRLLAVGDLSFNLDTLQISHARN